MYVTVIVEHTIQIATPRVLFIALFHATLLPELVNSIYPQLGPAMYHSTIPQMDAIANAVRMTLIVMTITNQYTTVIEPCFAMVLEFALILPMCSHLLLLDGLVLRLIIIRMMVVIVVVEYQILIVVFMITEIVMMGQCV